MIFIQFKQIGGSDLQGRRQFLFSVGVFLVGIQVYHGLMQISIIFLIYA